jgi:phage terminase Nu1 subunit (DNA packaging protein)
VVFGDLFHQRLRITREQADKLALSNQQRRGELFEADAIYRAFEALFVAMRKTIKASKLSDDEKADILRDLDGADKIRIALKPE